MANGTIGILCVDDNELLAGAMERRLSKEPSMKWLGWVSDASKAENAVAAASPDIVLLDVDMQGYDTLALVGRLTSTYPHVRVLMLSGRFDSPTINKALAAGARGYLVKDEAPAKIVEAVRKAATGSSVVLSNTARWMVESDDQPG